MRRRPAVTLALAAVAALVAAASARAYVRSHTSKDNTPLAWVGNCAYLVPDSAYTPDVATANVAAAIEDSLSTWNSTGCSYFNLKLDPAESGGSAKMEQPVAKNFIVFRQDKWCPPDPKEPCYDAAATALTTVYYIDKPGDSVNGRILDADIELNNINFAFTVDGTRPPGSGNKTVADIQNTLTHELGHLLGLDHTCYDGWNPCEDTGRCKEIDIACQTDEDCIPLDDKGQRIPSCSGSLPPEVSDATMFNYAQAFDTSKRTLTQDDINGVCGIYPLAMDPGICSRVDTSGSTGCAAGGTPPTVGVALLLALALALWRRR